MRKTQPAYMNQITDSLIDQVQKLAQVNTISLGDITNLLTNGTVTIDGKTITTTASIYRVAFGECMNAPSYALDLGKIEYKGKKQEVVDGSQITQTKEVNTYRTSYGLESK